MQMNEKKYVYNAYIMALFIFQFGYMQIAASMLGGQWIVSVSTLLLIGFACYVNKLKFNKISMLLVGLLLLVFLLSALFVPDGLDAALFVECIAKSCSAIIIAGVPTHGRYMYDAFKKVSVINFVSIALFPFVSFYSSMNYMRFGYAMVPSALIFLVAAVKEEKKFGWIILFVFSMSSVAIYGNRGATLVLGVFLALVFFSSRRINTTVRFLVVALVVACVGLVLYTDILIRLIDFLYYNIGLQTYSLAKFRMQIELGLAVASSGRDLIYESILAHISQNPLFGVGVGATESVLGGTAHNIFLQILLETGCVGLLIWIIIWSAMGIKYVRLSKSRKPEAFYVITVVMSCAITRLLVSSDMWLRPEYWFVLSFLVTYKEKKTLPEYPGGEQRDTVYLNYPENTCS